MLSKINGYKTYIVAAVTIAYALVDAWQGGALTQADTAMILGALGIGAVRHGINNPPAA